MLVVAQPEVVPVGSPKFLSRNQSTFAERILRSGIPILRIRLAAQVRNTVAVPSPQCVGNQIRYHAQTGSWAGKVRQRISSFRLPTMRPEEVGRFPQRRLGPLYDR